MPAKPATSKSTNPTLSDWFSRFANSMAAIVGSPWAFIVAAATIIAWAATGSIFHFSNTWQLIVNSLTNIVTYLVVFIIQNTQNRDSIAINLKLDELILSIREARDEMVNIESLSDEELQRLAHRYERVRDASALRHRKAPRDTGDIDAA